MLAIARPDAKKNLTGIVRAFGETPGLSDFANLVLIMGNRDDIDAASAEARRTFEAVLKTARCAAACVCVAASDASTTPHG